MKYIVQVTASCPYEVEADSPEDAERVVAEFVEAENVTLGDMPLEGMNPWPLDAPMFEYDVDADPSDEVAKASVKSVRGPVQ
jgi:hypothetical protein